MNVQNIRNNAVVQAILILFAIIVIHKTPVYLFFQWVGMNVEWSDLLDKIFLNTIVILIALVRIRKKNLWKFAGLRFRFFQQPYLYLILLFYLFVFTNGFETFRTLNKQGVFSLLVFVFLIKSITVGVLEEIVFRCLIQSDLLEYFKGSKNRVIISVCAAAAIFGFAHIINLQYEYISFQGVISQVFAATCLGALFGAILLRTKNIYPIIFIHASISFFSLLGTLFPASFPEKVVEEKNLSSVIASLLFTFLLFGSALFFALRLLKNVKLEDSAR